MKNKKLKKVTILAIALLAATVMLASCGAASKNDGMEIDKDILMDSEGSPNGSTGSTLPSYEEKGEMADTATGDNTATEYQPKIIKTANLTAETQDFTNAVATIEQNVKTLGGYIENCDIKNLNRSYNGSVTTTRYANYVLRIPADQLDAFLAETGELLNVTSSSSSAEDVSGEYYDMQARISVLETERALVEKMLSEATSINTMITLEERLYDIIYEIESYKTAIKVYDSKVAYSTVNLTINEVATLTPIIEDPSFGARFKNAVSESWQNTVDIAQELVIVAVYLAPFLAVLAAVGIVVGLAVLISLAIVKKKIRKARDTKK